MTATAEVTTKFAVNTVDALPTDVKAKIVEGRKAGATLSELKRNHSTVNPEVIRDIMGPLPIKASKVEKELKAAASHKGDKGDKQTEADKADSSPKADPKPEVDPKVATALGDRVVEVRTRPEKQASRKQLSDRSGHSQAVIWRIEQGRVRPAEVDAMVEALDAADRGELARPKNPKAASKADLFDRIEVAIGHLKAGDAELALAALEDQS